MGEHTGTHFDAPAHWVTGREYADSFTDTIPAQRFVAPACVIDCSKEAATARNSYSKFPISKLGRRSTVKFRPARGC
jgi:kynurenine formamidase